MLIISAVLAVFYPMLFAESNSVDDRDMIGNLLNMNTWSLKGLFVPGASGGLYYRPLLYLTFILDKDLWFLHESFMHLENILWHLINVLLVYSLAVHLLPPEKKNSSYLPLVAALSFGLHPLCTEPVNWISGRTDVMAGTFVLGSAVALLKFKLERSRKFLFLSIFSLLLGMLCKEVALAFVPGVLLLLVAKHPEEATMESRPSERFARIVQRLVPFLLVGAGSALLFFYLRSLAFSSNSSRITKTLKFIGNDPVHSVFVCLRAFGFYLKKIYAPFPLNFAIVEVDPLYELLAIPLVLLCIWLVYRRTLVSAIFLSGAFLIAPSFLIAFNQIAWTPYAERYAYVPSAFIIVASVFYFGNKLQESRAGVVKYGIPCLLVLLGLATLLRTIVWTSNLSLYGDTINKSPTFSNAWNEYAIALIHKGEFEKAKSALVSAGKLYRFEYDQKADLNIAGILVLQGREDEAMKLFDKIISKTHGKSSLVYEHVVAHLYDRLLKSKDSAEKRQICHDLVRYSPKLYALNKDPYILFRMGQIYFSLGERQNALNYYKQAYTEFLEGDQYKTYAQKLIARLEKE